MKKLYNPLLLLIFSLSVYAGNPPRRGSFAEKDIFQSAYFQRNVPGLVNDYHGQPVRYFASHDQVSVFFTDAGPIYQLVTIDRKKLEKEQRRRLRQRREGKKEKEEGGKDDDVRPGRPTLISYTPGQWLGANPHPQIEAVGKNTGTYNYVAGIPGKDMHSIVTDGFKKILYHDLYPGIDVEYSFPDQGGMKYDLIVHPGADASLIHMQYGGAARSLQEDAQGNMTVHTETGDIIEHTPVSYTAGGAQVTSAYDIKGTSVSFSLPAGYDHSRTLTIDPWVTVLTQLTIQNLGADVDYDVPGNLYVYGAGGTSILDIATADFEKVAKYNSGGVFQWVFAGQVTAVGWNTIGGRTDLDFLSNMKVDRINETVYVGCAFDDPANGRNVGTQVIELNNAGAYNNFISTRNGSFTEVWSFVQNCTSGDIIAMGGGTTGNLNVTVINPATAGVTINNFTGIAYNAGGFFTNPSGYGQDVVNGAEDSSENLFVVMASEYGAPQVNNALYRVNSTYTGKIWGPVATGYSSFFEAQNMPVYSNNPNDSGSSNNFNCLAVNTSYLYYYDGAHLKAFSPATGAAVGTAITIPGQTALWQGGIAVDRCNNLYLGGQGQILTYTFNGSTFTAGTPISLGAGFTGDTVFDVRYDALNNLLYVTGTRMAGTYVASLSTTCVNGIPYTDTVRTVALSNVPCSFPDAIVNVTVSAGVASLHPEFTYVWQDSLGNILKQSGPDTLTADTFTPPGTGKFTVQVELNENCGANSLLSIIYITSRDSLVPSHDTTICPGQPVTLSAVSCSTGGAYLWQPGGATTPTITVSPTVSTAYAVRYTPLSGQGSAITDSIHITVPTAPTVVVTDTSVCPGQPAALTATPSVLGGTYSWSPGGYSTQTITVNPASTQTYTVTYSGCGIGTGTGTVTISNAPTVIVSDTTVCSGQSATLTASPSALGGTYSWTPGGYTTQSITVSPATTTTYSVTYSGCGIGTGSGTLTISATVQVTVSDTSVCAGSNVNLYATPTIGGGTYSWSPGGFTTQSISLTDTITQTYTVTYTTSACGSAAGTGTVTITPPPTVAVGIADTTICLGGTAMLTATASQAGGTFGWVPGGATTASITVSPSADSTYYVSYVFGSCAPGVDSETVKIAAPIVLALTADTPTCFGLANGKVVPSVQPAGTYTYVWSNADSAAIDTALAPGTYTLSVTDSHGCIASGSATVPSRDSVALYILPADTTVMQGGAVHLNSYFGGYPASAITAYAWTPNTGLNCANCPAPMDTTGAATDTLTVFKLTVTYNNGCTITTTDTVRMEQLILSAMPDAFTPNGDNVNDTFVILARGVRTFTLNIFDRWGEQVFSSTDINAGWDGTYRGKPQPQGVYPYFFTIEYVSGKVEQHASSLTLLR